MRYSNDVLQAAVGRVVAQYRSGHPGAVLPHSEPHTIPEDTMTDDIDDIDFNTSGGTDPYGSATREQRMQRAREKHKSLQLSEQAYTLLMPVRASLFAVVKAFQYEAYRNGTMPAFVRVLRTMMLWAEVNMGRSDDDILDTMEDELERIRNRQKNHKKGDE